VSASSSPAPDLLADAEELIGRIGGFEGNGAPELAPAAIALALVGIGYELRAIRERIEREAPDA